MIPKPLFYGSIAAIIAIAVAIFWPGPTTTNVIEPPDVTARATLNATLASTAGAKWSKGDTVVVGQAMAPGEYQLSEGIVRIVFGNDAEIVVESPTRFRLKHDKLVYLDSGRLVGHCPTPASHGFTIATQQARVVDHGTEFGVQANDETVVAVFDGEVELFGGNVQQAASESIVLTGGKAGRVDHRRKLDPRVTDIESIEISFRRDMPSMIDLADVIAGGNGLGQGYEAGIEMRNGNRVTVFEQKLEDRLDAGFTKINWSPYIDGVFVPVEGNGSMTINSARQRFSFPKTAMTLYGPIWVRRPHLEESTELVPNQENWFRAIPEIHKYSPAGLSVVGVHSNAGITIDLQALREQFAGAKIDRFKALFATAKPRPGVFEAAQRNSPNQKFTSAVHIIVDGVQRDIAKLEVGEMHEIDVPLDENARYLTIAVTDGGDDYWYDWNVLGDPRIEISRGDDASIE